MKVTKEYTIQIKPCEDGFVYYCSPECNYYSSETVSCNLFNSSLKSFSKGIQRCANCLTLFNVPHQRPQPNSPLSLYRKMEKGSVEIGDYLYRTNEHGDVVKLFKDSSVFSVIKKSDWLKINIGMEIADEIKNKRL